VTDQPITSVLVANRGEIARRVFRTARAMGMRCIAVFVEADADAPFVREADEAIRLPDGYLNADAIIAAALRTGADAIHPGYGFLAENAAFAGAVQAAGISWVGPSPEVIETMGDKLAAKRVAAEAGVPTLPWADEPDNADAVGYPLLVKASAGGGGKGMRMVDSPDQLAESVAAAQREALNGFGDDTVFLERYVASSRHVEIQILGDAHGGLVHLGERECSIQRRHQKIIEESPSPIVDPAMRQAMSDAALALGRAMSYQSAGTVEFLVDDGTREFFFLEVNTRLQVEHPVTEEVTGIDLVREQLRVASGEPLGYDQDGISFSGHAVEARLYAEDPANGFLPAIGTLTAYEPAESPAVRWDTGVEPGSIIGVDFDPMIAKVIAHGPTRTEAAGRLALALEQLHLGGVTTNRDFLASTLRNPAFLAGDTTTDFIDRIGPRPKRTLDDDELGRVGVAAAMWTQAFNRKHAAMLRQLPSGFRNARLPPQRAAFTHDDEAVTIQYQANRDGSFRVGDDGQKGTALVHVWSEDHLDVEWDGRRTHYRVTRAGDALFLTDALGTVELGIVPRFTPPEPEIPTGGLVAPMPGVVLDVRCAPGDVVSKGDTLMVLEAMKMEHHMDAPADGVVSEVRVGVGGQVETGQLLVLFEEEAEEGVDDNEGEDV
jgi:propionyl-CoA carboxylase alpha chain